MSDLPPDVRDFLRQHIPTVMALEVLLHVRAHDAVQTPGDVSRQVGGSVDAAISCLSGLERSGLVERLDDETELRYRYAPRTRELRRDVDAVADTYARRKVAVVSAIFSQPEDPLRSFSDAFRLRKDR